MNKLVPAATAAFAIGVIGGGYATHEILSSRIDKNKANESALVDCEIDPSLLVSANGVLQCAGVELKTVNGGSVDWAATHKAVADSLEHSQDVDKYGSLYGSLAIGVMAASAAIIRPAHIKQQATPRKPKA
jgi:hypothetical protein